MEEKILLSIAGALSPILFSFIFKQLDSRNKNALRDQAWENAQKRYELVKQYYEVQAAFLEGEKLNQLKQELSLEAAQIKDGLTVHTAKGKDRVPGELQLYQKIFLTFKPVTFWGWIFQLLSYLDSIFMFFLLIGFFVDEQGAISMDGLKKNIRDTNLLLGTAVFILILLLFRWLALRNYERAHKKRSMVPAGPSLDTT